MKGGISFMALFLSLVFLLRNSAHLAFAIDKRDWISTGFLTDFAARAKS